LQHLQALVDYYGIRLALPLSRKYAGWYSRGLRDAKRFRETYNRLNSLDEAIAEINRYFDTCGGEESEE
jgi:tRNA-dihydrouridine synthase